MKRVSWILGGVLLLAGCGDPPDEETTPSTQPPPPPISCAASELDLGDGSCLPAGVPADGCAPGFAHDALGGCAAILPPAPCAPGEIAVPGDEQCRPVAECGPGRWGDIPVDASTQHVEAGYTGGNNDGSQDRPWTSIQQAIGAAQPGAVIAVADGHYAENLAINGKAVRLWGVCPALTVVAGSNADPAILIGPGAHGTEVRSLAIEGGSLGIVTSGSKQLLFEQLWVHGSTGPGIDVEDSAGAASATIRGTLVEHSHYYGVFTMGAEVSIESTAIRDIQPHFDGQSGVGLAIQDNMATGSKGHAAVQNSLIERTHDLGVFVAGADVVLAGTLVRDVYPRPADQLFGRGIEIHDNPGSGERPTVLLRGVVVERTVSQGIMLAGADVTLEHSVVRDTAPQATTGYYGRGVSMEPNPATAAPSSLRLWRSLMERNHEQNLFVSCGHVAVESTWVRDSLPSPVDLFFGRGIEVHPSSNCMASADIRHSIVERAHEATIYLGSSATVENILLRECRPSALGGLLGDGIVIAEALGMPVEAVVVDSTFDQVTRAGLANFGASVSMGLNVFECNAIDLAGQDWDDRYEFTNLGENSCGCGEQQWPCQVLTAEIEPPAAAHTEH